MKEITPAVVDNWSRKFKSRGMAGGTARNARSVLSLIFKYWCIRDDQVYNPVPMTSLPRGMKKTEREPPTPAQLAAVKAHPESFGLCAWLFMYTGCRLGEVLALQWRDIDWEISRIHVSKSVTWIHNQPVVQIPKTKNAARIIPLLSPLCALLEPLRGQAEEYIHGGEQPLSGTSYQRRWTYYCKGIGLAHYKIVTRKHHHKGKEYTTNAKVWEADVSRRTSSGTSSRPFCMKPTWASWKRRNCWAIPTSRPPGESTPTSGSGSWKTPPRRSKITSRQPQNKQKRRRNLPLFCTTFLRQNGKIRGYTTFYDAHLYTS